MHWSVLVKDKDGAGVEKIATATADKVENERKGNVSLFIVHCACSLTELL